MDERTSFLSVYCCVPASSLQELPTESVVDAFFSALSSKFPAPTLWESVRRVTVPEFPCFGPVAEAMRNEGKAVTIDAELTLDCEQWMDQRQEEIARNHGNKQLALTLFPGKPTPSLKSSAQFIEVPLFPTLQPQAGRKEWVKVAVPSDLGRYDIDEIQVKLATDMSKSLPEIAKFACDSISSALDNGELKRRLEAFTKAVRESTEQAHLEANLVEIPSVGPLVITQLRQLSDRISQSTTEIERFTREIPSSSSLPADLSMVLHPNFDLFIVNPLSDSVASVIVEVKSASGATMRRVVVEDLLPAAEKLAIGAEFIREDINSGAVTAVFLRTGQVLDLLGVEHS